MSRFTARTAVAFACALASAMASASDVVPQAAAGVSERPEPPKLVVLRNGTIVEGTIRFAQGGYEVDSRGGRVFLAESYVWFAADHRRQAYEQMRDRAPCRTADDHAALAEWCLKNRLHSCAQEELRTALELEPDHRRSRSILATLGEVLRTGSPAGTSQADEAQANALEQTTLGGLPPTVAQEYVTRIQPLLVNRCANAACHGSAAKNDFVLSIVRPGSPAFHRLTQENLEAVRRYVSASDPASSGLLSGTRPGHGGLKKPLFPGPAGDAQVKALTTWVVRAAKASPRPSSPDVPAAEPALLLTGATEEVSPADDVQATTQADASKKDPTAALLRDVLTEQRPDAFDPEEFNRRCGPRKGPSSEPPTKGPTR